MPGTRLGQPGQAGIGAELPFVVVSGALGVPEGAGVADDAKQVRMPIERHRDHRRGEGEMLSSTANTRLKSIEAASHSAT